MSQSQNIFLKDVQHLIKDVKHGLMSKESLKWLIDEINCSDGTRDVLKQEFKNAFSPNKLAPKV